MHFNIWIQAQNPLSALPGTSWLTGPIVLNHTTPFYNLENISPPDSRDQVAPFSS